MEAKKFITDKRRLTSDINKTIANLEKAKSLWLDFYKENHGKKYKIAYGYGGLQGKPYSPTMLGLHKKTWETSCHASDLPIIFPVKIVHFTADVNGEVVFDTPLMLEDVFPVILYSKAGLYIRDTENKVDFFRSFESCLEKHDLVLFGTTKSPQIFNFLRELLFNYRLNGSKTEFNRNYPKVIGLLKELLRLLSNN